MSKYRVTLTPVDKFFFGGDMTFQVGNNEKDSFNQQYSSYIIRSNQFPQQTSLLGMLRFLVLRNAGETVFKDNKIVNPSEAGKLIGNRGFTVNNSHGRNGFGKIKSISRVKVLRGDVELEFAPLFGGIESIEKINGTYNLGFLRIPNLGKEQYEAKDGLTVLLTDGTNKYSLSTADIFIKDRRIGISRNIDSGKTDDGALFKQISYRFNDKCAKHRFVFYAEVDDIRLEQYSGQLVTVGGDNSQFIIEITDGEDSPPKDVDNGSLAISLLSPAFLTRDEVRKNSDFAITQLIPFRFLTDRTDNKEDDDRSFHVLNSKLKRSERYELYAPGTVFYCKDKEQRDALIAALEGKDDFRQIGYNEYRIDK